jgi:NTE family protein
VVAVVLSGGSAFGMAHVGVLEAIEAAGIPIDIVVGTSMGSIVGGMYAAGYSPAQMEALLVGLDWTAVFSDNRSSAGDRFQRRVRETWALRMGIEKGGLELGDGLIAGQSILTLFTTLTAHCLDAKSFDSFPVPYRAVAADLMTGEKVVIGRGSLAEAMRSSMSIPAVFRPYVLEGRTLVDGGMVDDLPVDVARQLGADIVIAVESRGPDPASPEDLKSPLAIAGQTANLMILQNLRPSREAADLFIKCDLHGFSTASYQAAARLIERGREAGRAAQGGLEALARRIAADRPLVQPGTEPNRAALVDPPVFASVRVEGAGGADADFARKSLAPLTGHGYRREDLKAAIDAIYATGHFDLVKLGFEAASASGDVPAGVTAVVSLLPDASSDKAIFAGISYSGVYSSEFSNSIKAGTALFLQDLSGKDSALLVNLELMSALRLGLSYFQPLGPFYLAPWLRYDSEYDSVSFSASDVVVGSKFRSAGGGLWAGLALGRDSDLAFGWSWESVHSAEFAGTESRKLSALRGAVYLDGRDASAFPERGLAFVGQVRWAGGFLGGELSFFQAEAGLDAAFPIGHRDFLGLSLFAGTDLEGLATGATSVPTAYRSTIRHSGMFYGMAASDPDAWGDHAAGLGLELRRRISGMNPLLGKVFAFGNASLGLTVQEAESLASIPLLWCASAGFEVRMSRSFGIRASASLIRADASSFPVAAALGLEVGSFLERPEDRR